MNGWTTTKVFRINGKLVVGRSVEDAIRVFRNYCSPNSVNIESIEMVFGDTMKLEKEAIIAECDDRKAAETIALLTEEVEKLKEQVRVLEERPSPPVVLGEEQ
jgi:hypothetical protein